MLKVLVGNKKFYIWGACYKSDWLWKLCENEKIEISGYIDNRAKEIIQFHNLDVFKPDDILKNKDCFIFIALDNMHIDIVDLLRQYELKEFQNYLYPSCSKIVLLENHQRYIDFNGNEIRGDINGFRVIFSRGGSKLTIGKNCSIDKSVLITLSKNATVAIGDNCKIEENCIIDCFENSVIKIGNNSSIGKETTLRTGADSTVIIGDHFRCVKNLWIRAGWKSICIIGNDCLFARDIDFQCADGHNYFDLDKNMNLNMQKRYRICIGDHVWIGAGCKLLYGADIGSGSIVGMGSFVNKSFPNNIILAGNPAKCIRENVAWNDAHPFCNDRKAFEAFDFRMKDI